MSNSSLVCYTRISPNKTSPRNHAIDTITIHCMAGNLSIEACGSVFAPSTRQVSSNYGIGTDGRIAMFVEEKDRSWCSSSGLNDHRAVTIEVANDGDGSTGWHVSDNALASLVKLVTDICQRNGIEKLLWQADKSLIGQVDKQNMTVHRWFAAKACPGEYLYSKHSYIADAVNKLLLGADPSQAKTPDPPQVEASYPELRQGSSGSYVEILQTRLNLYGASLDPDSSFGRLTLAAVEEFQKKKHLLVDGVVGPVTWAQLRKDPEGPLGFSPYTIRITAKSLNVRKGPGIGYDVVRMLVNDKNTYTIVEESSGSGANLWGRLKSGIGWIALDYTKKI